MKKYPVIELITTCVFVVVLLISCDDTKNTDLPTIPTTNVSFSEHIQPILNLNCISSGCHNDQDRAGSLSLTNWANTTASYIIVAPGYPDNSQLVLAVEGKTSFPMPPTGYQPLTSEQIAGIRTWVKEGAKNN